MPETLSRDETMKLAADHASDGFLCSESVLMAISRSLNIQSDLIPKIATGFGAGIGRQCEVCGALAGGVMGLGLRFGRSKVEETQGEKRPYWFSQELVNRFRSMFGAVRCCDLLGLDLTRPDGIQEYRDRRLWDTQCRELIVETTGLVHDIIDACEQDNHAPPSNSATN